MTEILAATADNASDAEADAGRCVLVYERVSSDRQDIARQQSVREWAREMFSGREIVIIQDDGVSAFKVPIFDRTGGKRACELIEVGRVEAVCTDAQDRLSRGEDLEWVTFRTLCEKHDTRIVIDRREVRNDLGGRVETYLKALLAREESRQKSHNVRSGKRTAAIRGRPSGGPRKFGYDQRGGKLYRRDAEFAALRHMGLDLCATEGLSDSENARRLNALGIRTVRGARWSQTRVAQMLSNRLYAGYVRHRGEWFKGNHEPVFTEDEWETIQRARATRRRGGVGGKGGRPTAAEFLFIGGMLRCGACGSPMRPRTTTNSQGRRYALYRCGGALDGSTDCTSGGIRREVVEGPVVGYFDRAGLSDLEEARRVFEERREHDLAHVRGLRESAQRRTIETTEARDRIRADYKVGRISAEKWNGLDAELEAEHDEAVAEADLFERREAELRAEHAEQDIEQAALQRLADLRSALTAPVRDAETVAAVRLNLATLYDHFVLCRRSPDVAIGEQPTGVGDGLYLRPVLREDAFDHLTATTTQQPIASRR